MATYLWTSSQVLLCLHCQHLHKEKEPVIISSVLKMISASRSILSLYENKLFIEISNCTLFNSITIEGINTWLSFPLFIVV